VKTGIHQSEDSFSNHLIALYQEKYADHETTDCKGLERQGNNGFLAILD
jgi:hypothetical protein